MNRVPAPGAGKGSETILPDGTLLKEKYCTEFLAVGGMSLVYRARCQERQWLLKEVPASDARALLALGQEKSLLERLDHPSIVKSHEMFEEDGYYYLVRDFVEGQTLEQLLPAEGFLEQRLVLEWALRLCSVLDYLHSQNPPVIYRDLKPKNVIKDENGKLMLFDFGIARSFKEGKSQDTVNLGSALTASPEHYGGQTDARSDLYTLGATLHYLLTGGQAERESPFQFPSVREVNPQVTLSFDLIIARCLERKPEDRFQNAQELAQALLECNTRPGAQALAPAPASNLKWAWGAVPLVLLLAWLAWPKSPNPEDSSPRPTPDLTRAVTPSLTPSPEATSTSVVMATAATTSPTPQALPVPGSPHPQPAPAPKATLVHPQLENPGSYPQSHAQPGQTPTPTPQTPRLELPPLLVDTEFAQAQPSSLTGRRDPQGVWLELPGIRYRLPRGYQQIGEGIYVKGQARRARLLAVRPLPGGFQPEDYAAARQAEVSEETMVRERKVSNQTALELSLRRPNGRRVLVATEVYTTAPNGAGWCISASSAGVERAEVSLELRSLLESISF